MGFSHWNDSQSTTATNHHVVLVVVHGFCFAFVVKCESLFPPCSRQSPRHLSARFRPQASSHPPARPLPARPPARPHAHLHTPCYYRVTSRVNSSTGQAPLDCLVVGAGPVGLLLASELWGNPARSGGRRSGGGDATERTGCLQGEVMVPGVSESGKSRWR